MSKLLNDILAHQYEASLCMLHLAVEGCPQALWNAPLARLQFCQAAFHVVFFADVYLQARDDVDAIKTQPFHLAHKAEFRDYEELEDREQILTYEKVFVLEYLQFARRKAQETTIRETAEMLAGPSGFRRRTCSRAELHIYNIRHIQHHAAQLILRLRLDTKVDVPWVGHAWRNG